MDVADWLRNLGLEQYAPAFRANEIDERVLPASQRAIPPIHKRRKMPTMKRASARDIGPRSKPYLPALS